MIVILLGYLLLQWQHTLYFRIFMVLLSVTSRLIHERLYA